MATVAEKLQLPPRFNSGHEFVMLTDTDGEGGVGSGEGAVTCSAEGPLQPTEKLKRQRNRRAPAVDVRAPARSSVGSCNPPFRSILETWGLRVPGMAALMDSAPSRSARMQNDRTQASGSVPSFICIASREKGRLTSMRCERSHSMLLRQMPRR